MNLIDVRRCYMNDNEWERTSSSYKDLMPLRDFNSFNENDETPLEHYTRLKDRFNIPLEVIEQWFYPHYYNVDFVNNYGWLNFDNIAFELIDMSIKQIMNLEIFSSFESWVRSCESREAFEEFTCIEKDKNFWIKNKTWRIPPIVIDVSTLNNIPEYSEIKGMYQIVEGHK